jgi:hypothetical protein
VRIYGVGSDIAHLAASSPEDFLLDNKFHTQALLSFSYAKYCAVSPYSMLPSLHITPPPAFKISPQHLPKFLVELLNALIK